MINFVLAQIVFSVCGVGMFLFTFWKRLREDYNESFIFNSSFYVLFGIVISVLASLYFFEKWWFWFGLFGAVLGTLVAILRFKLRVLETLESSVLGGLNLLILVFFYDFVVNLKILSGVASLVILMLIALFIYLDKHYKDFSWYKSGRIGFSGLTILGLFFLIRAAVALVFKDMVSFVSEYEVALSAAVSFISFLAVFNLSRIKT